MGGILPLVFDVDSIRENEALCLSELLAVGKFVQRVDFFLLAIPLLTPCTFFQLIAEEKNASFSVLEKKETVAVTNSTRLADNVTSTIFYSFCIKDDL